MPAYSQAFRDKVARAEGSAPQVAKRFNVAENSVYNWRAAWRRAKAAKEKTPLPPTSLSSQEKFHLVVESMSLNEQERGEFCRRKGILPEHLDTWRASCQLANTDASAGDPKALCKQVRTLRRELREQDRELTRKEKALAEAAALLVLRKKLHAHFGEDEDV